MCMLVPFSLIGGPVGGSGHRVQCSTHPTYRSALENIITIRSRCYNYFNYFHRGCCTPAPGLRSAAAHAYRALCCRLQLLREKFFGRFYIFKPVLSVRVLEFYAGALHLSWLAGRLHLSCDMQRMGHMDILLTFLRGDVWTRSSGPSPPGAALPLANKRFLNIIQCRLNL